MAFRFNFFDEAQPAMQEVRSDAKLGISVESFEVPSGQLDLKSYDQISMDDSNFDKNELPNGTIIRTLNGGALSGEDTIAKVTDVLPKVYEGGLKIWECSYDAISCLETIQKPPVTMLDLGCGAGLVGIWALVKWPESQVVFHDLNLSVLERSTLPNVRQNGSEQFVQRSMFLYGPWSRSQELKSDYFDLISTADTLYDPECHRELHDLLVRVLKSDGIAIIAAKRFYFGVGGGVSSFRSLTESLGKANTKVIASFEDGSSNIRDVLQFTRKV